MGIEGKSMRRFVVIATTVRGRLVLYEELDSAGQWEANRRADLDDEMDRSLLRGRATAGARLERDKPIRRGEDWPARKPPTAAELTAERIWGAR
jgi:hypothetical protein